MNKITTNTTCHCCEQDTILRIVSGNDFSLRLTLTYKEDDTTKQYDLSDVEDLLVNVVTPDGDRIELDSMIDEQSKITAIVDAQQLKNYIPYGIEVIWHSDTGDKRAAAPNLFTFVNSSREANDAQDVIIEGPYDYNLEIRSDVAYVTLGEVPDLTDYVTHSQLDDTLTSYITSEVLSQQSYVTEEYLSQQAYITIEDVPAPDLSLYYTKSEIDDTLENYVTDTELNTAISPFITNNDLSNVLENYVSNTSLEQSLEDYALETDMTAAQGDISSLDTRVTTLENNPQVPSNVVTSDDGNEIICLTQAEYDALEQAQTLDPDAFYYITDATSNYVTNSSLTTTLTDYATKNYVDTAVSQVQPDTTNLVTINTAQTISGAKTFTAENKWTHESRFGHFNIPNNSTLMNTDIAFGVNKSGMFVRPQFLQGFIGQVLAPMNNYTNSASGQFDIQQGVIKFQTVDSVSGEQPSSLSTLAKIDSNGIYEGTTLLSNKYAQINDVPTSTSQLTNDSGFISSGDDISLLNNDAGFITLNDIPQSSGVSEEDWDNSNEAIAQELTNNRLEHLSINDNFSNYYTKTEADSRYATASWANNKFVTQTDDTNRQQAIAAAFASSVQSTSVHNIWTGSQSDYDQLTPEADTLYIII